MLKYVIAVIAVIILATIIQLIGTALDCDLKFLSGWFSATAYFSIVGLFQWSKADD